MPLKSFGEASDANWRPSGGVRGSRVACGSTGESPSSLKVDRQCDGQGPGSSEGAPQGCRQEKASRAEGCRYEEENRCEEKARAKEGGEKSRQKTAIQSPPPPLTRRYDSSLSLPHSALMFDSRMTRP